MGQETLETDALLIGSAEAVAGQIVQVQNRPAALAIPGTAAVLPSSGGSCTQQRAAFELPGIVSIRPSFASVEGNYSANGYRSVARTSVEGLRITSGDLTLETGLLSCAVTSWLRPPDATPIVTLTEVKLAGLKLAGSILAAQFSPDALTALYPLSAHEGVVLATIVQRIVWGNRVFPGNELTIPGFGRIYFGELLVAPGRCRLSLLRVELGSPVVGSLAFAGSEAGVIQRQPRHALKAQSYASRPSQRKKAGARIPAQFTAYHSRLITQQTQRLVVYVHTPDSSGAVASHSRSRLGRLAPDYAQVSLFKPSSLRHGSSLLVVPEMPGSTVHPASQRLEWRGELNFVEFLVVRAEGDLSLSASHEPIVGRVAIYLGPQLIAEIQVVYELGGAADHPESQPPAQATANPYQKVFASYAHTDRRLIEWLKVAYDALGWGYWVDFDVLRSGEMWNPRLLKLIEQADIFQLLWSLKASRSPYVEQEWRHALGLNRPNFIRPVCFEKRCPDLPLELSPLHLKSLQLPRMPTR